MKNISAEIAVTASFQKLNAMITLNFVTPMILLSSKNKYLQFKNIRNTIQHNFIAFAEIESYMIYKNI